MAAAAGTQSLLNDAPLPLVINTWPWTNPTLQAWKALERNASGIDALVAGCSAAEADRSIPTVGWGGSPNEDGETTLDALLMDGPTHNVGAVGCMKRIKNAIGVARHVLENTKHTLLVGDDATEFAVKMGFAKEDLHSKESEADMVKWSANNCQPNFWQNVTPDPSKKCGPYQPNRNNRDLQSQPPAANDKQLGFDNHDTIGMVIIDRNADVYAGTSTNGAKFKIPGRVGDSPVPGSGAYVDNDIGTAAATGDGDVMMRFLPSYQAVENMRQGMSPQAAAENALRRIARWHKDFEGSIVAANKKGEYGGASFGWDFFKYSVMSQGTLHVLPVKPIPPGDTT